MFGKIQTCRYVHQLYRRVSQEYNRKVIYFFQCSLESSDCNNRFWNGAGCSKHTPGGPSDDCESYIQETGRAGRDGDACCAMVYHASKDNRFIDKKMVEFCTSDTCKRKLLFSDFEDCELATCCKCYCCNICMKECMCSFHLISNSFFLVV